MLTKMQIAALLTAILVPTGIALSQDATVPGSVDPTPGALDFPEQYREWVYLSTGFDMSYSPASRMGGHHMFDNVFVNPEAYRIFRETGTWPDGTILVTEVRGATGQGSINKAGNYQSTDFMGIEVHKKDVRLPGKWAFYGFDSHAPAPMIPTSADCYQCHTSHAAVDTTFVQFYPTLLPIAEAKGTLSDAYRKEIGKQ